MEKAEKIPLAQQLPEPGAQYPLLICGGGKNFHRDIIFCSISSSSGPVSSIMIPELQDNIPLSYSQGWLLLSKGGSANYSLLNLKTKESIDLPRLKLSIPRKKIADYLLSSPPTDPNCLVLQFESKRHRVIYWRPGDKKWSVYNYGGRWMADLVSKSVICCGKIYVSSRSSRFSMNLLLIDVDESKKLSLSMVHEGGPNLYRPDSYSMSRFLVESRDELLSILYYVDEWGDNEEVIGFEVDKFNFSTKEWEKVKSLNGRAILLGPYYSLSYPVDYPDMEAGSCIYFVEDETLYKYSIEDESITVYSPCHNLPEGWNLTPAWLIQQGINVEGKKKEVQENTENEEKGNTVKSIVENTNGKEINLCDLPPEMLTLIAGHLSFVDHLNFRCVNGICASVRLQTNSFTPCFMFSERAKGVYSLVDSNLKGKHTLSIPKKLEFHYIRYSKDGWLLVNRHTTMDDRDNTMAFFNPFTEDVIGFGERNDNWSTIDSFIFTSSPTSSDCVIIGLSYRGPRLHVHIIEPLESSGYSYDNERLINDQMFEPNCNSPVFFEGSFYYLGKDGRLGVLEFEDNDYYENANWEVIGEPPKLGSKKLDLCQNYLIECNGELLSVCVGPIGKWVRVFKFNRVRQVWKKIKTLGRYSLYVSRSSSLSAIAKRPDMANRIYFPRFYGDNMLYYSLDTNKFHSLECKSSLENFYGTRGLQDCAWVELPSWHA